MQRCLPFFGLIVLGCAGLLPSPPIAHVIQYEVDGDKVIERRVASDALRIQRLADSRGLDAQAWVDPDTTALIVTGRDDDVPELLALLAEYNNAGDRWQLSMVGQASAEAEALEVAMTRLRERAEPHRGATVELVAGDRLEVALPDGVDWRVSAESLDFVIVDEAAQRRFEARGGESGQAPPGRRLLWEPAAHDVPNQRGRPYIVHPTPILDHRDVASASLEFDDNTNRPFVSLAFNEAGSEVFCQATAEHVGDRFAIVVNGDIVSAPSIRERICGGRASIVMGASQNALEDATALVTSLNMGAVPPLITISERRIGR